MQKLIHEAIVLYMTEHGYSPTFREIAAMVGLKSTSSVYDYIKLMLENGMLETDEKLGTPRAIRVPGYKFQKIIADT